MIWGGGQKMPKLPPIAPKDPPPPPPPNMEPPTPAHLPPHGEVAGLLHDLLQLLVDLNAGGREKPAGQSESGKGAAWPISRKWGRAGKSTLGQSGHEDLPANRW